MSSQKYPDRKLSVVVLMMIFASFLTGAWVSAQDEEVTPESAETELQAEIDRGQELRFAGDFDGALEAFNHAIELDPESASAYTNRGLLFFDAGRYEDAIADYTTALEFDSTDALIYANRASAYGTSGQI